jgi:amidase
MLDRRTLLKAGAAGAATAALGGRVAARPEAHSLRDPRLAELDEITFDELGAGMAEGRWTAVDVTRAYLQRIEDTNHRGPALHAVIETNPDAEAIAAALDAERAAGTVRGPLHGVPILLKDNIATADRTATAAGSLALAEARATRDAEVARRLREAGAVLLG